QKLAPAWRVDPALAEVVQRRAVLHQRGGEAALIILQRHHAKAAIDRGGDEAAQVVDDRRKALDPDSRIRRRRKRRRIVVPRAWTGGLGGRLGDKRLAKEAGRAGIVVDGEDEFAGVLINSGAAD